MSDQKLEIAITYCRVCGFLPRATWTAQELLATFAEWTTDLRLVPGGSGQFEVTVDGDAIFSRKAEGRFPEMKELREAISRRLE
ncbi:MAG: Rdx family protein [Dehalococcoidia bacterium]